MRKTPLLIIAAVLGTCGTKAPPASGQDTIQVDTSRVQVAAALVRVTITPLQRTVRTGDTLVFRANGIDADGDSVPVSATWTSSTPSVELLEVTGTEVRGIARIKGRALVTVDPATIVRLDIDSITLGWLPENQMLGSWAELSWSPDTLHLSAIGDSAQMCAYAWKEDYIAYMSDGAGCPQPPTELGQFWKRQPLVKYERMAMLF